MPHLTAVTIPVLHGICFVVDFMPGSIPESVDWHNWRIVDNVWVEVPTDLHHWPDDNEIPEGGTLCRAKTDPQSYRVFKRSAEVLDDAYDRLHLAFGGIFSVEGWERFARILPQMLEFYRPRAGDEGWTEDAASAALSRTAV